MGLIYLLLQSRHIPIPTRTALFWVITQQVVTISYRRFGSTYRSHPQGSRNHITHFQSRLKINQLRCIMRYLYKKNKLNLLTGRTTCDFRKLGVIVHAVATSLYTFDMQAFQLGILMAATSKYSQIIQGYSK
jgi:hypothetical protein